MKARTRKTLIRVIIISVAALAAVFVVFKLVYKPKPLPQVKVQELEPGEIVSTVTADGELRAYNQVDISAEVVARIKKIYVKEGDYVTRGQLLCLLDDSELRAARGLYLSQLGQAKSNYERGKALYAENLISGSDYEDRRTAYEVAQSNLKQSEDKLAKTRIYAPAAGRVVGVAVEEGETAVMGTMNNAGTVMFTLGDLSAMQAWVYVDEADIVGVAIGQPAFITLDAMPEAKFKAKVETIGFMPAPESETGATDVTEFRTVLDITDVDKRLRPGMTVAADITTASVKNVIFCPLAALGKDTIRGKEVDAVYVLEGGRAVLTPVTTGISDGTNIEITKGLRAGQVVITGPFDVLRGLRSGDAVAVEKGKGEKNWSGKKKAEGAQPNIRAMRALGRATSR